MKNKKISIILPTYNERDNIRRIIPRLIETCEKNFNNFEIIIVDDNSLDGTKEEIKKIKDRRVKLFVRKSERGLASAIKFGIKKSRYDYVCIMDADLQHPPEYIPKLYNTLIREGVDIVIASRFLKKSKIVGFKIRRLFSKFGNILISSFFPNLRNVTDPLSGFFLINKKKIKLDGMKCIGFKFLFELLVKRNLKVREIPYKFEKRKFGKSKMSLSEVFNFLKLYITLLIETKEYLRILKFLVVGMSGIIINETILFILTDFFNLHYMLSALISIEGSIIWNFFLGELIVFSDLKRRGIKNLISRLLKSNLIRLVSVILNILILFILVEFFSIHYLISNLIGILFVSFFNYYFSLKKVYN